MAGIYIHVPFCKQACHYCDFHFSTSLKLKDDFLKALQREMVLRSSEINEDINTIYFGGGTPSLLNTNEISSILNSLSRCFHIAETTEITLEANPDDLNQKKLKELFAAGVNRLSVGIQSLNDNSLKWMNRAHDSSEARACLELAQSTGFQNISIDLIYGLPGLSLKEWEDELKEAFSYNIQHVSAYCLTVEPNTALGHWVKKGKEKPVDDEAVNNQFQLLIELAEQHGLEQYEVSNFGKSGFYSQHNTSYWHGIPYLGLGPSAHSYIEGKRSWNIANNARYIRSIGDGKLPISTEVLSKHDLTNEYIMTGLRTKWGIDLERLKNQFGYDIRNDYQGLIKELIEKGLARLDEDQLVLTKSGLFMADGIASDFFILEYDR
jgi:oxygen-independent coproporphyrinogen-3 oxidase